MSQTANVERFTCEIEGVSQTLRVFKFQGKEGLSVPFHYDVELVSEDAELDFSTVVDKKIVLTLDGNDETRYINGIVSRFSQGAQGKRFTFYRATIVPKIWRLDLRQNFRIFQEQTVPDIIKAILDDANIPGDEYSLSLQENYPAREYCVQYRESDWDFITRLMSEIGLSYFFVHDEQKHVLTITDNIGGYPDIGGDSTVIFRAPGGGVPDVEHVRTFSYSEQVRPGKVKLRDFNFKKPSLSLENDADGNTNDIEVYDYPGLYDDPDWGSARAGVSLEALQSQRKVATGQSNCVRFVAGHKFSLSEHSRDDFNRQYTLINLNIQGSQPQVLEEDATGMPDFSVGLECIPGDVPFRTPATVIKPEIKGPQTAIVVGPEGEEIYTDEHGRVKVQFHWDRYGNNDQNSSCWIRVSQVWAGAGWGAMYIPRINQEVIVDFLDGDPDQPIITGRVYHGTNRPPYPLPEEKTKSTIKSNSSIGGGGFNEFRFEDKKGSEEIYLHGQKDWNIVIENDKSQEIGHDETLHVAHDRTKSVDNDQSETIGRDKTISVAKNHQESIGENANISIGKDATVQIGTNLSESVGKNADRTVADNSTNSIGKNFSTNIGEKADVAVGKAANVSVADDTMVDVGKALTVNAEKEIVFKCGSASISLKNNGDIVIKGGKIKVNASGDLVLKGSKISEN